MKHVPSRVKPKQPEGKTQQLGWDFTGCMCLFSFLLILARVLPRTPFKLKSQVRKLNTIHGLWRAQTRQRLSQNATPYSYTRRAVGLSARDYLYASSTSTCFDHSDYLMAPRALGGAGGYMAFGGGKRAAKRGNDYHINITHNATSEVSSYCLL